MMNKKQREKNTSTMTECLGQCEFFLNDMDLIETEAAGFSFKNALGLELESDENGEFSKEGIMKALKEKVDSAGKGTDADFAEAYSTLLFAVRMLYSIHEHARLLEWYAKRTSDASKGEE